MLPFDPKTRQEMVRRALQEKAPQTYQELKDNGKLQEFVVNHTLAMMEEYDPMSVACEAVDQEDPNDYLKQVQAGYRAISQLDEQTLATWLDFSDPPAINPPLDTD